MPVTTFDYLIIGGGIAGTTAAEELRRGAPDASIAIVSGEPYRLYSRVMLSKPQFFLEKIPFDQIWLKTEGWYPENRIDLLKGKFVTTIDTAAKKVRLDDGSELSYGKLLIAAGSVCRQLPAGSDGREGISYLKTLDDAKGIIARVKKIKNAVVVGGGFISFEMCDMLRLADIEVTVVLREPYFWDPQLDEESGRHLENAMKAAGVKFIYENEIAEVLGEKEVEGVVLRDGTRIDCGLLVVGIGSCLSKGWLAGSGVDLDRGILTNEYLETSVKDVWAAGDVAEFHDLIFDRRTMAGTWVNAQVQGRLAAQNMLGKHEAFRMLSYYTAHGFGTSITFAGDVAVREGRTVIRRGSKEQGTFSHFIVHEGRVIGATFMNRGSELAAALKLISGRVDVSGNLDALGDPGTDPATLVPKQ